MGVKNIQHHVMSDHKEFVIEIMMFQYSVRGFAEEIYNT